ncbi:MAG: helix-turn-helix domain-containing protein [Candidatus Nanopelagicales bacterium]
MSAAARAHAATARRLERAMGSLGSAATARMDSTLPWFRQMSADQRAWVGLVAQAGIAAFVTWFRTPDAPHAITADVFGTAPRELVRAVSLQQTVEMVRATITVVEERVDELAAPGDEAHLREALLRYSREIAFAAAEVYARAAEARGAWDARLEALVIDALLRDEVDDDVASRAAALGWGSVGRVLVLAGGAPTGDPEASLDILRRAADHHGLDLLTGIHGSVLVAVVGGARDPVRAARHLVPHFGPGPVVLGPLAQDLAAAAPSARQAMAGLAAAPGWPDAPRPVAADDLLPERALAGDAEAISRLVDSVHEPLVAEPALLETAATYLERASSLEACARLLFVHPNTVRYRLRRIAEITGYPPTEPRGALTLRLGLVLGRLAAAQGGDHEATDP